MVDERTDPVVEEAPVTEEAPATEETPVAESATATDTSSAEASADAPTPVANEPSVPEETPEQTGLLAKIDRALNAFTSKKWAVITNKALRILTFLALVLASYCGIAGLWFDFAFITLLVALASSVYIILFAAACLFPLRGKKKTVRRARKKAIRVLILCAIPLLLCILQLAFSQIPHRDGRYGGFWNVNNYDGVYYDIVREEDGTKAIKICDADVDARIICIPKQIRDMDVKYIYGIAFANCENLTEFIVSTTHEYYEQVGGVLYTKGCETLVCYPRGAGSITHTFAAPGETKIIAADAFRNNRFLTTISLPGVVTIEDGAFANAASLSDISLSNNLLTISHGAFAGCTALRLLDIPESVAFVGNGAFEGFTAAQTITIFASADLEAEWSPSWNRDCSATIDRNE